MIKNKCKVIKHDSGVHGIKYRQFACVIPLCHCVNSLLFSNSGGFMAETIEYANSIP